MNLTRQALGLNLAGMTTKPAKTGSQAGAIHGLTAAIALAACAFTVPALAADSNVIEIQLTPSGDFKPSDGRKLDVPAWRIDQDIATRVIERFKARVNPPVVDYEHQTLHKETNGQPAPAAAWMRALQWREGSGLWATVELTARAADLIRSGEYKFVSPVFAFDGDTGEVLAIHMAAFTNDPAIDGMEPLAMRAAASFGYASPPDHQDKTMNKLLAALCALLGLDAAKTTEDEAVAACNALRPQLDALQKIGKEVGVEDVGDGTAVLAACTTIKAKAASGGAPDPAKFVAVGVVEQLKGELAALSAKQTEREVGELVESGLADGRLLLAQKDWATDLGKKDIAALTSYLKNTPPIGGLRNSQTGGSAPSGGVDENGLSQAELAVCSATGVSPKDFAAAKPKSA